MKTVVEILEAARLAILEDRDEMSKAVPDNELANYLVSTRYIFDAAETVKRDKLLRLGAVDCALDKAKHDALAAKVKELSIDSRGMSRETLEKILEAKKNAKGL